ncbi:MAG: hypothetical protein KR126chlam6_01170, partial [Candidatus Anoxychlamydiales bacterium]|nr:hypothetical protein [Candidatus Anoxychlamydiales bacterium]
MRKILFLTSLCFCLNIYAKRPAAYKDLKEILPANNHGWFYNAKQLNDIFEKYDISTIIELGSWLGRSTVFLANKIDENGKVYAVDHWQGSIEHTENDATKALLPTLYEQFLSNMVHAKLTKRVIPIRETTYNAAFTLDVKADLIYLDAAHDEKNVFQDIYLWYPKLKEGGIMCGDNWAWA